MQKRRGLTHVRFLWCFRERARVEEAHLEQEAGIKTRADHKSHKFNPNKNACPFGREPFGRFFLIRFSDAPRTACTGFQRLGEWCTEDHHANMFGFSLKFVRLKIANSRLLSKSLQPTSYGEFDWVSAGAGIRNRPCSVSLRYDGDHRCTRKHWNVLSEKSNDWKDKRSL